LVSVLDAAICSALHRKIYTTNPRADFAVVTTCTCLVVVTCDQNGDEEDGRTECALSAQAPGGGADTWRWWRRDDDRERCNSCALRNAIDR
jgi:hypothetical protein